MYSIVNSTNMTDGYMYLIRSFIHASQHLLATVQSCSQRRMGDVTVTDDGGQTMKLVQIDQRLRVCNFDRDGETELRLVEDIKTFPCKEDDIFLFTPIKSGTHWTWEILNMLLKGRAETIPKYKSQHMLEHETRDSLSNIESPRVLNSHLPLRCLPTELFQKRCKIVFVLRNPKDMLVSWYNHCVGIKSYAYSGEWEHFLNLFWKNELEYCSWFDYVKEWETFSLENPTHPLHILHYEDLQRNNTNEIRKLAKFIQTNADNEDLIQAIASKCSFPNMKKDKMVSTDARREVFNEDFTMYRKGIIGDWKNWFTVAQSEYYDKIFAEKMNGCSFKFQFS